MKKTYKLISNFMILFVFCLVIESTVLAAAKTPSVPVISSIKVVSTNSLKITWNKAARAKQYEVYASVNGGTYRKIATVKSKYYLHKKLKYGATYAYKVRSVNGSEKSGFSKAKRITIPVHSHDSVIDKAVEPTCTKSGKTEGKHCKSCGAIIQKQKILAPLGHTSVIDKAKNPTCTKSGKTEGKHCSVCGKVLRKQSITPPLGHTPIVDMAVTPTCTESGKTEGSHCATCGEIFKRQDYISPLGHTIVVDMEIPATKTESGLTQGSHCSICGEVIVPQEVIPMIPMDTWDYYMKLKDVIIQNGVVNSSGNPVINNNYVSLAKAGIVYEKDKDSFKFILDSSSGGTYNIVNMVVRKSDVLAGTVNPEYIFLYTGSMSSFKAQAQINMSTYSGSNANITNLDNISMGDASTDSLYETAQTCIKLAFNCWKRLLYDYNTGVTISDLGFKSF